MIMSVTSTVCLNMIEQWVESCFIHFFIPSEVIYLLREECLIQEMQVIEEIHFYPL